MSINAWMSWEGGVDLAAATSPALASANVIVHVARMVHTPVGSASSGMILWQPNPDEAPQIMGFVSTDENVGAYFGAHIFAGTPFENAPVLLAKMTFDIGDDAASARVEVGDFVFESRLTQLYSAEIVAREMGALPFVQSGVEAIAASATLQVNGENVPVFVPEIGLSGGPGAVFAPIGWYAR